MIRRTYDSIHKMLKNRENKTPVMGIGIENISGDEGGLGG